MYKALYRKYRPVQFDDVYGQEHITTILKNQIISDRISHAYIFTGIRGTGKTSIAKILARAVNCLNPQNGNPCNACTACVSILDESAIDVNEIDAASNNKVDDIREILDETRYTPAHLKKRVYIIDEVHMLTTQAFNALLKTLEEPPEYVLFILATTEIHKVLPTILSRCQRFDFRRIANQDIKNRLIDVAKKENFILNDDAAELIAKLSEGGLRDALSILDRCVGVNLETIDLATVCDITGVVNFSNIINACTYIIEYDTINAINAINEFYNNGAELSAILEQLMGLFRDILLYKITNQGDFHLLYAISSEEFISIADKISATRLTAFIDIIQNSLTTLKRSQNKKIDTELCIIKLCKSEIKTSNIDERLDLIEDKVANFKVIEKVETQYKEPEKPFVMPKVLDEFKGERDDEKYMQLLNELNKVAKKKSTFEHLKENSSGYFSENVIRIITKDEIAFNYISGTEKILYLAKLANNIYKKPYMIEVKLNDIIVKSEKNAIDNVFDVAKAKNIQIKVED